MLYTFLKLNRNSFRFCSTSHSEVRVRFAPSPTGSLHLGGLRTAFYNYLFAKKNGGKFILRIEDTDQKRVKPGSIDNLNSMLKWAGILPDESSEVGGPFAPYIQSERLEIYKEKANILLKLGAAYKCFCSETTLNLRREKARVTREYHGYDNNCRHLKPSDEEKFINEGKPFTIRFKIPEGPIAYKDMIYGENTYHLKNNEGDFVILKSDGFPTYHFSSVVDDNLMKISHVLRGMEWLISTPKHICLYHAFGWTPPIYAHLPLLVNSDRTKLSKRQDSVSVEYYKNKGYFPEALLNFVAAHGGGFGRLKGGFTCDLDTLCSKFELQDMNTNSCIVDLQKLDVFNQNFISKQLSSEETASSLIMNLRSILEKKYGERYEKEKKNLPDSYILNVLRCYKERLNNLSEFVESDMDYLWDAPDIGDTFKHLEELKVSDNIVCGWKSVLSLLSSMTESEFSEGNFKKKLKNICTAEKIQYMHFMRSLRVVLTGQKDGPSIGEILVMLGKHRSINKISFILDKMGVLVHR